MCGRQGRLAGSHAAVCGRFDSVRRWPAGWTHFDAGSAGRAAFGWSWFWCECTALRIFVSLQYPRRRQRPTFLYPDVRLLIHAAKAPSRIPLSSSASATHLPPRRLSLAEPPYILPPRPPPPALTLDSCRWSALNSISTRQHRRSPHADCTRTMTQHY
ncbi:hypothetical protein FB451DRAFT_1270246 [Mycena latifolia]|nr:hypothetical protein FB451DRAFT_1270246 [Mycena latifolia]